MHSFSHAAHQFKHFTNSFSWHGDVNGAQLEQIINQEKSVINTWMTHLKSKNLIREQHHRLLNCNKVFDKHWGLCTVTGRMILLPFKQQPWIKHCLSFSHGGLLIANPLHHSWSHKSWKPQIHKYQSLSTTSQHNGNNDHRTTTLSIWR